MITKYYGDKDGEVVDGDRSYMCFFTFISKLITLYWVVSDIFLRCRSVIFSRLLVAHLVGYYKELKLCIYFKSHFQCYFEIAL